MTFKKFGLMPELVRACEEKGYTTPTTIQSQSIPLVLAGHDLLAGSQTGTGKTAGFTLPLLQNLMRKGYSDHKTVRALILTPTRELAMQVEESVRELGKNLPLKSTAIFGGVNIKSQVNALHRGVDIVVATPGRLLDLVNQKEADLSKVEILVLDEADRMLDMGFLPDIKRILKQIPKERQNLFFSATFSSDIKKLASELLKNPKMIEAARLNSTVEAISQVIHPVDSKRKRELLSHLIKENNWKQVLVFMRTKHSANKLAVQLGQDGINAMAIHGNKSQGARIKALEEFKNGTVQVLVATDIAARGLDIDQLPHVVNFDLPNVSEDYVHRIGRTGRAGKTGEAVSLVCIDEHSLLKDIERLLKVQIRQVIIPGFEPDPRILAEPIINGRRTPPGSTQGKGRSKAPQAYQSNKSEKSSHPRRAHAPVDKDAKHSKRGEASSQDGRAPAGERRPRPEGEFRGPKDRSRSERPSHGPSDRPSRGPTERSFSDRPSRGLNDRPSRGPNDRPARGPNDRPSRGPSERGSSGRPARGPSSGPSRGPSKGPYSGPRSR